jgi:GDPmannose 4,6-dehydratase
LLGWPYANKREPLLKLSWEQSSSSHSIVANTTERLQFRSSPRRQFVKRALITGITGQDGSYLTELLLGKGYEGHGIIRRASTFNTDRLDHIYEDPHANDRRLYLHYGDLSAAEQFSSLVYNMQPDEIYHLGAQSHVRVSFDVPEFTGDITGLGTTRILEAVRKSGIRCRFYQAGSSEMFGSARAPQNENTPFHPRSPYGAAKLYSHWMAVNYREAYGMFCANGILFNHESPRRGETFVSRKITRAVVRIRAGTQTKLYLGNLDARRDWGYAPEYVEGMWQILQQEVPSDYVLGTGEAHTVREFLEEAFGYLDLDWRDHVEMDPRYVRPAEVEFLRADAAKAHRELGWEPKIKFKELVRIMVDADAEAIGMTPRGSGRSILDEKFGEWHRWAGSVSKCLEAVAGTALAD